MASSSSLLIYLLIDSSQGAAVGECNGSARVPLLAADSEHFSNMRMVRAGGTGTTQRLNLWSGCECAQTNLQERLVLSQFGVSPPPSWNVTQITWEQER